MGPSRLTSVPCGSHDLAVGLDQATIEGLRAMIRAGGARQLAVGDLRAGEVAGLAWSGNPAHLRSVAAAPRRAGAMCTEPHGKLVRRLSPTNTQRRSWRPLPATGTSPT